jgi:hypothetical protein
MIPSFRGGACRRLLLPLVLLAACQTVPAQSIDALRARYAAAEAAARTGGNPFDRPLYLQSTETSSRQQADVVAVVDEPYADVRALLTRPEAWCAILILHLNVKYCRASPAPGLDVAIGRKTEEPLGDAYWVVFGWRLVADGDGYLNVSLAAPDGPLSTKDFRIEVEAAPQGERRTLLHMTYAYAHGTAAKVAMQLYLSTIGSGKVGFSVTGRGADGKPVRVGGMRGVLERNTMRYYLAIEAALAARALPPAQRLEKSLADWFDATERYPQLHEVERDEYLTMKQHEVHRQATQAPPARTR